MTRQDICFLRLMLSNGAAAAAEKGERERENFFTTLCGLVYMCVCILQRGAHNEISCQTRLAVLSATAITIQLPTQWLCHKLTPAHPAPPLLQGSPLSLALSGGGGVLSPAPIAAIINIYFLCRWVSCGENQKLLLLLSIWPKERDWIISFVPLFIGQISDNKFVMPRAASFARHWRGGHDAYLSLNTLSPIEISYFILGGVENGQMGNRGERFGN